MSPNVPSVDCIDPTYKPRSKLLLLTALVALALTPTLATALDVDTLNLFELDANANDNPNDEPADDWDTPPDTGGAIEFTGILPDVGGAGDRIFAGNNKDIHEINTWTHKPGPLAGPDKNDITNAYAAAYESGTATIAYFG